VDVAAAVGANQEAAAVVEPGEGALDDPAVSADAGAVLGLAAGDHGFDAAAPDEAAVLVVVEAAVSDQRPWSAAWAADAAADRRHPVEQLEQLGDVVAVAAGERPGEWDAAAVHEQVVLAACAASIDRAGTRFPAPLFCLQVIESTIARSHSSWSAACSSASNSPCSRSHTLACCQARSLRQAVIPQRKPSSCGRCSQPIPVCSTKKIPCSAKRSSNGFRPGYRNRRGFLGSSGSIRSHNPSDNSHGFALIDTFPNSTTVPTDFATDERVPADDHPHRRSPMISPSVSRPRSKHAKGERR